MILPYYRIYLSLWVTVICALPPARSVNSKHPGLKVWAGTPIFPTFPIKRFVQVKGFSIWQSGFLPNGQGKALYGDDRQRQRSRSNLKILFSFSCCVPSPSMACTCSSKSNRTALLSVHIVVSEATSLRVGYDVTLN
jgi:hypothetical protein